MRELRALLPATRRLPEGPFFPGDPEGALGSFAPASIDQAAGRLDHLSRHARCLSSPT